MPTGVYVSEVISGGGAEKAGITKGVVITGIEGTSVNGMDALQEMCIRDSCKGILKERYWNKAGRVMKFKIQNGFYKKVLN